MSAPAALITPKHIFGFNHQISDNLCYMNEQNLVFIAGAMTVIYNVDHNTQRFVSLSTKFTTHLMFLSPNRQYMAVGERSEDPTRPHLGIGVYDLIAMKKINTLSALKIQRQFQQQLSKQGENQEKIKFVSGAFSHDGKFLIGQVGPPEWTLVYWSIENEKALTLISLVNDISQAPIHQVMFHLHDNNQVSVVGDNGIAILQLDEAGSFKMINNQQRSNQPLTFWCHSWVSDNRILVGCDKGTVLLMEGSEINQQFQMKRPIAQNDEFDLIRYESELEIEEYETDETDAVLNLITFSKGFICSCGGSIVYLFERYAGGKVYRQAASIQVPEDDDKIQTLTMSLSEDVIAIATTKRVIYTFTLTAVNLHKQMVAKFEPLTPKIHCAPIVDMAICLQKPLTVSCSRDGAIAVWNYATNQQQLFQHLHEPIFSLALHPTGHYVVAGCKSSLKLMSLMIDELRTMHEFAVKECSGTAFSNNGHLIAAVQGSIILVFSTITFETVASFKGHVGKIVAIDWSNDDLRVISSGVDGAIMEWDVHTHKRSNEVVIHSSFCTTITAGRDNFTIFAAGSDCALREIAESQVLSEMELILRGTPTSIVTLHCGKGIVVSSSKGDIWLVSVPFSSHDDGWQEIQSFCSDVVKLRVTKDDKWLMSVSIDGSFCIWSISDRDGRPFQTEEELPFLEEILITRADLEEKNLAISELTQQLRDIKIETVQEMKLREEEHSNEVKQLMEDNETQMKILQDEIRSKDEKIDEINRLHEKTVVDLKNEMNQTVKRIKQENDQKLLLEYEKTDELQLASENMSLDCEQKLKEFNLEKMNELANLNTKHECQLQFSKDEKIDEINRLHEKTVVDLKNEMNQTVKRIKQENDQKLLLEYEKTDELQLASENMSLDCEQKLKEFNLEKMNELANLNTKHECQLKNTKQELQKMKTLLNEFGATCEENIRLLEEETNEEMKKLRQFYEDQLTLEKQNLMQHKSEIGVNKRKLLKLTKDIEDQMLREKNGLEERNQLQITIDKLRAEVKFLKNEVESRDNLLEIKELEIHKIKEETQCVEQLIMLEAKTVELNQLVVSKQRQIENLSKQLKMNTNEKEVFQKENAKINLTNQQLKNRITAMNKSIEVDKWKIKQLEKQWTILSQDLIDFANNVDNHKNVRNFIVHLIRKYKINSN